MGKMAVHDEVLELLPWFVNNSLADKERARIMAHLIECSACRTERDQLQHVQDLIAREDFDMPDYRFPFRKLMNRIDASERNRQSAIEDLPSRRSRDFRWPLFASAASLVLGVFLLSGIDQAGGISVDQSPGMGRTLTLERQKPAGTSHLVELIFEQSIEAQTQRAVFVETGSYIVSGPDAEGRYVVAVLVPVDITDSTYIQSIRDMGGVKYAAFSQANTHLPP